MMDKFIESVNKIEAQSKEEEIEQFIKLYNVAIKASYQNRESYQKDIQIPKHEPEQNQDCLGRFPESVEKTAL